MGQRSYFNVLIILAKLALVEAIFPNNKNGSAPTILCMIHTATPSHDTRAETIFQTWAKRCDDYIFFTDTPMKKHIKHVFWPELYSRDHSWEKIRNILKHVAKMPQKFDWYLRADDDAYIVVENLRSMIAKYNKSEPHFLGYKWNFFVPNGYADGGAYVISKPVLDAFVSISGTPKCPDQHRAEEDQEIAKCLETVGIYPENARDEHGADRFHHFHPSEQLVMKEDKFSQQFSFYSPNKGEENFSADIVGIHHISPYEMRLLEYFLYRQNRSPQVEAAAVNLVPSSQDV